VIDWPAKSYDVQPIAIARITRRPANMPVVLGTTNPQRVTAAAAGTDIPSPVGSPCPMTNCVGH
jgi:predicted oxidoreductase